MSESTAAVQDFRAAYPTVDDADQALHSFVQELHAVHVPMARMLCAWVRDVRDNDILVASTSWFGHQYGLGPSEIHRLIALGFLLEEHPEVEEPFVEGRLSLENASLLHDLYSIKSAVTEGEDWLAWAIAIPTADWFRANETLLRAEVVTNSLVAQQTDTHVALNRLRVQVSHRSATGHPHE